MRVTLNYTVASTVVSHTVNISTMDVAYLIQEMDSLAEIYEESEDDD